MVRDLTTENALTGFLHKLERFLPDAKSQEKLRGQLKVDEDTSCCWMCSMPKTRDQFTGDSIICNTCLPVLVTKVDATRLAIAGKGYRAELKKLQASSQPEFISQVDGLVSRLKRDNVSLAEMAYDNLREVQGLNLSKEEQKTHIKDHKTAERLLKLTMDAIAKRDDQLSADNPYGDVDPDDLIGVAVETVIDEMVASREFRAQVVDAMYQRIPDLADLLLSSAGTETVEASS